MTNTKRGGSALLTVLWLTAALSAVGIAVASSVRAEGERASSNVEETKAAFVARGAIDRAALHLMWSKFYSITDGQPFYIAPGQPWVDLSFPMAEVHVEIIPEASKLNLNTTRPEELERLLIGLGEPEDRAMEITSAIVDWRLAVTPDRQSPFDPFYSEQRPSFLARHASFVENEEMLLVKGVTPELYYGTSLPPGPPRPGLRDCISVYGSSYALDINHVQPAVMIATGMPPGDAMAIAEIQRRNPILDSQRFSDVIQALGPAGSRLRFGGKSIYTLRATARLREMDGRLSDLRRTVSALIKFDFPGNSYNVSVKYEVLRWYDRN